MSKRTRAQTRRKKKRARGSRPTLSTNPAEANRVLDDLIRSIDVVPVETFPGGCHETLAHPDRVKFELGMFVKETPTALSKLNQLEADYARGKLSFVSRIGHWALERFLWHGLPSDSWHPIEAFLKDQGDRFPEPARQQLRRWKEAELNIFEIGSLRDDFTVALRPWDLHESKPAGSWFHAIDLSMGGVNVYQDREGYLKLNWLAPWAPEENLFCAMGYGMTASKGRAAELFLPRLTANADLACSRWPWTAGPRAVREYASKWRRREWQSWFKSRIEFPFDALVKTPHGVSIYEIERIISSPAERARQMGIYFVAPRDDKVFLAGATTVMPLDLTSANAAALAEYAADREQAGPPPAVRNHPSVTGLR